MKEDNTKFKCLPFGPEYFDNDLSKSQQKSEGETLNKNTTTLEATDRKDGDKIFNKRNQEEAEFNDLFNNSNNNRNIRIICPDENINQPAEVKTNHV